MGLAVLLLSNRLRRRSEIRDPAFPPADIRLSEPMDGSCPENNFVDGHP
jgi:hypothetical protein